MSYHLKLKYVDKFDGTSSCIALHGGNYSDGCDAKIWTVLRLFHASTPSLTLPSYSYKYS